MPGHAGTIDYFPRRTGQNLRGILRPVSRRERAAIGAVRERYSTGLGIGVAESHRTDRLLEW
jgi:hypothetical protein